MDLELQGRSVLITGASKGIGLACAFRFAAEGCHLQLAARTEADLAAARDNILRQYDVPVTIHPLDLSIGDNARQLLEGQPDLDILVNNAGAIPNGFITDVEEPLWREAWDLKVFGYINTCRAAYKNMMARGKGVIINIIGAAGNKPSPGYITGGAGNAALMALTKGLGAESLRDGIRVVAINPGLIHTERLETQMRRTAELQFNDESRWRELISDTFPPGQPQHIADMTSFLASDLSANTTGTVVTIDGGYSGR
jgi:NAD(P)-dependent dehydrogenase (short-subunit alcohol dehydrogenase family)